MIRDLCTACYDLFDILFLVFETALKGVKQG